MHGQQFGLGELVLSPVLLIRNIISLICNVTSAFEQLYAMMASVGPHWACICQATCQQQFNKDCLAGSRNAHSSAAHLTAAGTLVLLAFPRLCCTTGLTPA
jgi:hypothetical protein